MNSEKEFKDNLKEKLNGKEFLFDEANWLAASELIDASREEKKRRPFPFFLVSGITLLVSVFCFYIFKPTQKSGDLKLAVNTNPSSNQTVTNSENNNSDKIISGKNVSASLSTENNNTVVAQVNTKKAVFSESKEPKNVIIPTQKNKSAKNSNEIKIASKKIKKEYNSKTVVAVPVKSVVHTGQIIKEENKDLKVINFSKDELKSETGNVKAVASKKDEQENTKPFEKSSLPTKNETPGAEVNSGTVAAIAMPANSKADSIKNTVAVVSPKDSLPKALIKQQVHFISFEAGATYLFGWSNPGVKDGNGVNPLIGLNYSNLFTKKMSFSIGVYYTSVRNLSYSNYVVKKTHYDFGEENDVIVFTPTTLHYLVAPLRLSYALNAKNSIGLGCNIGYLFGVNSTVEFYSQHAGQKEDPTILKTSGYMQGFKTINTQLSVFYKRNLVKDLWLNAEVMYGLSNVKDNAFFKTTSVEKNTGLKLTLIYNLFKK